jgi:hypothetical protein
MIIISSSSSSSSVVNFRLKRRFLFLNEEITLTIQNKGGLTAVATSTKIYVFWDIIPPHGSFLLGLLFGPEDGDTLPRNVD